MWAELEGAALSEEAWLPLEELTTFMLLFPEVDGPPGKDENKEHLFIEKFKKKKLKIALYSSQREIQTVASREAPKDLSSKSHVKDYHQKLTYH